MESEILQYFIGQGAFGILFVWLLITTKKDNKEREEAYQKTIRENQTIIGNMTENFCIVKEIKSDVDDIKEKIFG